MIIADCLDISMDFISFDFVFVKRAGNMVAHSIAQLAQNVDFSVPFYWLGNVPESISALIVKDLNV